MFNFLISFLTKQKPESQKSYIKVFNCISNAKINSWPQTCCPTGYMLFTGVKACLVGCKTWVFPATSCLIYTFSLALWITRGILVFDAGKPVMWALFWFMLGFILFISQQCSSPPSRIPSGLLDLAWLMVSISSLYILVHFLFWIQLKL